MTSKNTRPEGVIPSRVTTSRAPEWSMALFTISVKPYRSKERAGSDSRGILRRQGGPRRGPGAIFVQSGQRPGSLVQHRRRRRSCPVPRSGTTALDAQLAGGEHGSEVAMHARSGHAQGGLQLADRDAGGTSGKSSNDGGDIAFDFTIVFTIIRT